MAGMVVGQGGHAIILTQRAAALSSGGGYGKALHGSCGRVETGTADAGMSGNGVEEPAS